MTIRFCIFHEMTFKRFLFSNNVSIQLISVTITIKNYSIYYNFEPQSLSNPGRPCPYSKFEFENLKMKYKAFYLTVICLKKLC